MLRHITAPQLLEWRHFEELEPFGEVRDDHRTALIATILANANRDPKKRAEPFVLDDFILKYEGQEERVVPKVAPDWRRMKAIAMAFAGVVQ